MNIYVSNLSFNVQDEDLRAFFASYGEITSVKIINDRTTGQSRGFGFVEMANEEESKKAISELDGAMVEGRAIRVSDAKEKGERSGRSTNPFRRNDDDKYNNANSYNKNRY